jgi:hypothetical protein
MLISCQLALRVRFERESSLHEEHGETLNRPLSLLPSLKQAFKILITSLYNRK